MSDQPKAPLFEPGNTMALRHGAYSELAIADRVDQVHQALLDVAPWLDEAHFAPAVARYLQATAREQLAHEALMASPKLSPRLLEAATASARLAWQIGDALGLTPAGHAKLRLLTAGTVTAEATLADALASGRAARTTATAAVRPIQPANHAGAPDNAPDPQEDL